MLTGGFEKNSKEKKTNNKTNKQWWLSTAPWDHRALSEHKGETMTRIRTPAMVVLVRSSHSLPLSQLRQKFLSFSTYLAIIFGIFEVQVRYHMSFC